MSGWLQIVASNVAVAGLVAGLAWVVGRSGRRAALAHVLWVVFFLKLVTPPLLWLQIEIPAGWLPPAVTAIIDARSQAPAMDLAEQARGTGISPQSISDLAASADVGAASAAELPNIRFWDGVALVWMAGFLLVFAGGLIRYLRFRRLLVRVGQRDPCATLFVSQLLRDQRSADRQRRRSLPFSISRSCCPDVLRLPVRVSPMLFGFGRCTVIVCPDRLWRSLSDDERQVILAHEAAHYFRGDHWVRWLEWIVTALYWWFPAVYLARRELERHEEAACDAWAVRVLQSPPRRYAEALLRVVDFLCEQRVGVPRLASGMQPTSSLEQRLHMLMRPDATNDSRGVRWTAGLACVTLWLVHPCVQPQSTAGGLTAGHQTLTDPARTAAAMAPGANIDLVPALIEAELPEPPRGFWNQTPRRQWASFSLALPGARVIAESSRGIIIERVQHEPLMFSCEQLSCIVEIPDTRRVVIGDALGGLRLWDLEAGLPTSLIGRHAASVTSLAYHPSFGLVSADKAGSVMRWDLQSGQVLATWTGVSGSIQSVRGSADGRTIAVLAGTWQQLDGSQDVHLLDANSLETEHSFAVPPSTAVVVQVEPLGWTGVDWSGTVRLLEVGQPVMTIAKHKVSALVLSQEADVLSPHTNQQNFPAAFPPISRSLPAATLEQDPETSSPQVTQ